MVADANTGGPRIWTDQAGQARTSYEITAQVVRFIGGKGEGGADAGAPIAGDMPGNEEDLPF